MTLRADEQTIQALAPVGGMQPGEAARLTLGRKFLLVFAALGLVGLGNWRVVESALSRLEGATSQVNVIGSIRWISQKVQADTLGMAHGKGGRQAVEAELDRLDGTIRVLADGGERFGLAVREPSQVVRDAIEPLRLAARDYRAAVARTLDRLSARQDIAAELDALAAGAGRLWTTADGIAAALSAQIADIEKDARRQFHLLALLDLGILLAALAALRIQILRPLRALTAASRRFARGHFAERVGNGASDEIGELGRAFDRMAGEIERDIRRIASDRDTLAKAQHDLRMLSRAVEHSPSAVSITDTAGRIEYVNPKFTEISGYSREEAVGRNIGFLKSGQTPDEVYADLWQALAAGREWRGVLLNRKKGGALFRVDTRISPLADEGGRTTHFITIQEDVTERQRAAEALRLSQELFRMTFDSAAVGIALYDLAGRFLLANGALRETLGYGEEALLHMSLPEITHPDDRARDADLERQVLEGSRRRYAAEKRLIHREGHVVWVVLSVALVRDRDDAPMHYIGQIVDITPRKTMEQELIASRADLRTLAAHHDAVREEERKRIALEIHDELGQLLTALKMDISLLRMHSGADPAVVRRTDDMRELVEKTIGVVRQVASNLRPAALNLGIVPALEWLVEDFGRRTGIAYELNLFGDGIELDDARATAVFRIVQESLTNVMRHAAAAMVAVTLGRDGDALLLEVRDDGCGFDLEAARRGPSFGLRGIRERVRGLGGALSVDSGPGRGTALSIRLPRAGEGRA